MRSLDFLMGKFGSSSVKGLCGFAFLRTHMHTFGYETQNEGYGTGAWTVSQHLDDTLKGMYTAHPSSAVRGSGHCQRAPPPLISILILLLPGRGFPHQRPYSSLLDVFLALAMISFDDVAESWLQLLWSDLQRS